MNIEVLKKIQKEFERQGILENPESAFSPMEGEGGMYYVKSNFLIGLLNILSKQLLGEEYEFKAIRSDKEKTLSMNTQRLSDMIELMKVFTSE